MSPVQIAGASTILGVAELGLSSSDKQNSAQVTVLSSASEEELNATIVLCC